MKIQSQFKDYYDHVAYVYGGGDPKTLYIRNRLGKMDQYKTDTMVRGLDFVQPGLPTVDESTLYREFNHNAKWLAINGKLYLILSKNGSGYAPQSENWTVLDQGRHPEIWEYLQSRRAWWRCDNDKEKYIGREMPEVLELSRKVNTPVFTFKLVNRSGWVHVDGNIPILSTMGIPTLIPAEQLYQDIAYFLGNTMHVSPDLMPAIAQTDKEKISAAGFDVKQSFRHRT